MIKACIKINNGNWVEHLQSIITQTNHTKHNSIGMTPFEALRGSFPSKHLGSKRFVADAIAQAKLVRDTVLRKLKSSREKMQKRYFQTMMLN